MCRSHISFRPSSSVKTATSGFSFPLTVPRNHPQNHDLPLKGNRHVRPVKVLRKRGKKWTFMNSYQNDEKTEKEWVSYMAQASRKWKQKSGLVTSLMQF